MAFSGTLTLTDLNDFITPAQACIKPVEQTKPQTAEKEPGTASTEILIDASGTYYEVSSDLSTSSRALADVPAKKLEQAQISLNDCLACSGCITSAESVLITLQSHTEVFTFLQANGSPSSPDYKIPVISIAPQSLASLAASLSSSSTTSVTPHQVLRRLQVLCKEVLGFEHVFDTTFARHIVLKEHVAEFEERRANDKAGGEADSHLPMLASACPGWICYAEKAHAEMLPFISRTKSPQQVMGTLVKEWMGKKWDKSPNDIYHVSVMPCYDKKLEASRQDFYNDVYSTRDVDCVITTGELELMMREKGRDLSIPIIGELDFDRSTNTFLGLPVLLQHPGTSSGSYLHAIINHIRDTSPTPLILSIKAIRNADYEEYTLTEESDQREPKTIFKGAKCYGFRNLQNIVRKVGRERGLRVGTGAAGKLGARVAGRRLKKTGVEVKKERQYDYVEVMACPGGCVNGGGQLKPVATTTIPKDRDEEGFERNWENTGVVDDTQSGKWGDKEWTKKVEEAYWRDAGPPLYSLPTPPESPPLSPTLDGVSRLPERKTGISMTSADELMFRIFDELSVPGDDDTVKHRAQLFRTQYRAVESEVIGLAVKW
ncbi:iron hydrogenase [Crucibulum laeve]|uniref:Cytosolic Fe-S cluster assembly factor NAR1 n=1 Tax=Crucibulum laeve TaxID=68775 RepID=A0A5C3MIH9_9AGAR|nr:iron hydrogenase [Crucibulum laeve]